ncbi:MAG TPA: PEGA domain-containing protein [Thermoanaerobaculia bacterium]|nr:PEGA domain-containing protein [Thermoanaerobaculia bacterium]
MIHRSNASPRFGQRAQAAQAARGSILLLLGFAALATLATAAPAAAGDDRRPSVRSNRGHVSSGHARHGYRPVVRHRRSYYGGFYYRPSFYSSWYWPAPYLYYRPYGAYAYDGYGSYGSYRHPDAGALDLDIKPEKASVYLDGELIGIADNYDGWPRYLWLRAGTYRLVIHHPGYQTLAREVRIRPGEVIRLKDKMQRGESKSPEELFAQVERPARRETDEPERREVAPRAPVREDDWRERAPPAREPDWRERDARPSISSDRRAEPARLRLQVEPADAVVYLDGRLLGSGAQLARLHSDLLVDPGAHRLEVARPGYQTRTLEFEVEPGEERDLTAELEPEP